MARIGHNIPNNIQINVIILIAVGWEFEVAN
jgi:hypothetical protein